MNFTVSTQQAEERNKFFRHICQKNLLRMTPQKQKIYEVLSRTEDHPTAQEIFEEVQKVFPNISFATVYKNLKLFTQKNIIQELDFGENFSRYDALLDNHHHIYDTKTSQVIDVNSPNIPIPKELQGRKIKKIQVQYFV